MASSENNELGPSNKSYEQNIYMAARDNPWASLDNGRSAHQNFE